MNYRPYPDVDRALAQLDRGRLPAPPLVATIHVDTTALEAVFSRFLEAFQGGRQAGKSTIPAAIVDHTGPSPVLGWVDEHLYDRLHLTDWQRAATAAIADTLARADGWDIPTGATLRDVSEELYAHYSGVADAVLAVLPEPADRAAALRDHIAAAMREHYLSSNRDEADADRNMPCVCGDWREPGAEADDENDWDAHLADAVLAVLYREWPWLRAEAEDAAPADQAVKAGEHVHVAGPDGERCAGGGDACSQRGKEPEKCGFVHDHWVDGIYRMPRRCTAPAGHSDGQFAYDHGPWESVPRTEDGQ